MYQSLRKIAALAGSAVFASGRLAGRILFPPVCPGCNRQVARTGTICPACWSQLQFLTKPCCPVTGLPFRLDRGDGFLSGEALSDPPPFDHARAVVEHDGLAQNLVTRLKYGGRTELAPWMAMWMMRAGEDLIDGGDFVIPVPLHRWRFWRRGYNQSAELARIIAQIKNKRFCPEILVRKKYTRPQVGLGAKERKKNVYGVFVVPRLCRSMLKGKHIILVDDVYTTGATVKAATRMLKRAGAARVDVITFSRVVTNRE